MPSSIGLRQAVLASDDPLPPSDDLPQIHVMLEDLYRAEQPGLLRYLARFTSLDIAHDAIQQVFVRLAAHRGGAVAPVEAPRAYLRAAVANEVKNEARFVARRRDALAAVPDDLAEFHPVACLEARDRLDRIERAVQQLKPLTRQVFLARRVDGYSYAEIATRTGLSERGVEKQMRVALHKLGRHLRQDD